jgi:hypothetical protein
LMSESCQKIVACDMLVFSAAPSYVKICIWCHLAACLNS